jgi:hypothetical protein
VKYIKKKRSKTYLFLEKRNTGIEFLVDNAVERQCLSLFLSLFCVFFVLGFCFVDVRKSVEIERETVMEGVDLVRAGVVKTKVISTFYNYYFLYTSCPFFSFDFSFGWLSV